MKPNIKKWVVYVSTFPPRECGIATFTQDLMTAFNNMYDPREEAKVVAMNIDDTTQYIYDTKKVIYQIPQPDQSRYIAAAKFLNSLEQVALVHVQHEFGIFGGVFGRHIVLLLRELNKPAVVTFHTVLPSPDPKMKETVQAINNHVQSIIVMTNTSKQILADEYGVEQSRIIVIPHGIHPVKFSQGIEARKELGFEGRKVISTFGLLSRGKGIEYGIEAMKGVIEKCPEVIYLVIGETHPVVRRNEGEVYYKSLIKKVHALGLKSHVFFYYKYLEVAEILRFLEASHIYLALSQNPNQAVSGTLSYALGSGKSVISTSFAQAKEEVGTDLGILVGFNNSKSIAEAILDLVTNTEKQELMSKNAYFMTRGWTWPNIMLRHMTEYIRLVPILAQEEKNLPKIKLDHIYTLTDDFGMIQFAKLLVPDLSSGYTTDDNARALVAAVKYYDLYKKKQALLLIHTYLNFLEHAQIPGGGFHNYVNINKKIPHEQHNRENLESATARALYALAVTALFPSVPVQFKETAVSMFRKHMHVMERFSSPRSIAYQIKALYAWNQINPSAEVQTSIKICADKLITYYEKSNGPDWKWFEDILAYSNGIMPDSLADAYRATMDEKYLIVARESIDFLIANSFEGNICMPIGQKDWFKRGLKKSVHDQQPEEVATLVSALKSVYEITRDETYFRKMRDAFYWFLGNNFLTRTIYDYQTGGCYDGIGERDVNFNEGAESTVMYLLARLEFERQVKQ